jgi:hypothetical protein
MSRRRARTAGAALACALAAAAAAPAGAGAAVTIAVDRDRVATTLGGGFTFTSTITNTGRAPLTGLVAHMNIASLRESGAYVDPEDWSPQRTQYVEPLPPGQSATLSWRVNAILDGDFMVYMVAIPAPTDKESTSQPVASSGIHLTVTPYTKLNPGGVLPYAIGGPLVLGVLISVVYRRRRRQIDLGG